MNKDAFDFIYNAEGDCYDLVVDKKIQKVVEELKALPHDVLIRYLTYWSEDIDGRKYVVESDFPHDEWYAVCCDYAASDAENGGYPPTQNGDIRSLFWLFSLMALQN